MVDKRLALILNKICTSYLEGSITIEEALDNFDKFIYSEVERLKRKRELSFKREEEVEE